MNHDSNQPTFDVIISGAGPVGLFLACERHDRAESAVPIEVLKGPQGTAAWRNSSGGDINVITNEPKLQDSSVDGGATFANFNTYKIDGAVNTPIHGLSGDADCQGVAHSALASAER
jgi:hypothetical protein